MKSKIRIEKFLGTSIWKWALGQVSATLQLTKLAFRSDGTSANSETQSSVSKFFPTRHLQAQVP
jgi:hypothetical protein